MALAHPWVAPMMRTGRPSLGPNALEAIEWALCAVDGLGLSIGEMSTMVFTLIGVVHSAVQSEISALEEKRRFAEAEQEWEQNMAPHLEKVVSSGDYPLFSTLLTAPDGRETEADFDVTLAIVLDGLEKYIDDRARLTAQ